MKNSRIGSTLPEATIVLTEEELQNKESKARDIKALTFIHSSVLESIFSRIVAAKLAKEVWTTLQNEFKRSDKARNIKLQTLRRDFENLRMKDNETVKKDYSSRMLELVNQMKLYGEILEDQRIVEKVLRTMPERFDAVVTSIEYSKGLSDFNCRVNWCLRVSRAENFQIK